MTRSQITEKAPVVTILSPAPQPKVKKSGQKKPDPPSRLPGKPKKSRSRERSGAAKIDPIAEALKRKKESRRRSR